MFLPANIEIRIPSTSANLGPGFDLFGLAIDCYNRFEIEFTEPFHFSLFDRNGNPLQIPEEKNLIRIAYLQTLADHSPLPGFTVRCSTDLPVGSGFGSSAAAIVCGLLAANAWREQAGLASLSREEIATIATDLEGHPDNVVPAIFGGLVISAILPDRRLRILHKTLPDALGLAVVIPDFQISTTTSRTALPESYPLNALLSNLQGVLLWMEYLQTHDTTLLVEAIRSDRLHEPYRGKLIPGYEPFLAELAETECFGATISGSGPGILVYYPNAKSDSVLPVLNGIVNRLMMNKKGDSSVKLCRPDTDGAVVTKI